jgi:hypothetical protein
VIIDEKVKDEEEPKKEDELSEEDVKWIF